MYESSDGTKIDLMGSGVYAQDPESLNASSWDYNEISGASGINKIKRFYKKTQSLNLTLDIMADSEVEFNRIMGTLRKAFDGDVRKLSPGKIWWNDYYKQAYIIETSHSDYDEIFESVTSKITVISLYPYWLKESVSSFPAMAETTGTMDYGMSGFYDGWDYDKEMDFGQPDYVNVIHPSSVGGSNFVIIFYGPASDPSVTIGDHEYQVYDDISEGEYIIVDSLNKKIKKHKHDGTEVNDFALRNRDSYIFEPIPDGDDIPVLKPKDLSVDIMLYNERSEPMWI